MKFGIKTLDDFELKGKTVLMRVDINEPINHEDGTLNDITRIEGCLPTIKEISDAGAKLVLMAHQGSGIEYENFYTTAPHAKVISKLLGREIKFVADVAGPTAVQAIKDLGVGEILLLDNVRFLNEEDTLFEKALRLSHKEQADTLLIRNLAPLGDIYVNDAFAATHRDQPSLCAFQQILPSAMGRLFEKEYEVISELIENPAKPCVFVLGGSKISDAFLMMESVLAKGAADHVLTGGLVGQVMNWAAGVNIGKDSKDFITAKGFVELVPLAKDLLDKYGDKIVRPVDGAHVIDGKRFDVDFDHIVETESLMDIGAETAKLYSQIIADAKTVFVNGPMGVFEKEVTQLGTKTVFDALGSTAGYTVIGGGDSITASKKYDVADKIDYVCTAGGALIRFLSGEELPVVKALKEGATK
ncbi:MAG: phosphoglycerate kinase [Clostridiales Family XIII bacterium]|jgi:phosphoglycerate kinase|nr:phosphoglycerate kinase [Clostridiales Family XIII bacterium]